MPLPIVAYRLIGRFSVSRFDRILHPLLYRRLRGQGFLGRILGCDVVLLTTTGRRSRAPRTVALFAFSVAGHAGSWAVIASRGGSGEIPAWYRNLKATPRVEVQVRGRTHVALAREVYGIEYETIFEHAAQVYSGFRLYRAEAAQHVPIVVLDPGDPDQAGDPAQPRDTDERGDRDGLVPAP